MADPVVTLTNGVPTSGTGAITTLGQTLLDGANATIGAKADAAAANTDTTPVSAISIWKQISASIQTLAGAVTSAVIAMRLNATPSLANGNGVVPTQGGAILTGANGMFVRLTDSTNIFTIKAASTPAVLADTAVVVSASPNSPYTYNHISTNTTTAVKSGAGTLQSIVVNTAGATDTITIYDSLTASGAVIAVLSEATGTYKYNVKFGTGLTIVTAGTTAPDVTVTYV